MKKRFWIVLAMALLTIPLYIFLNAKAPAPKSSLSGITADDTEGTKVVFFGDQGYGGDAEAVLRLIKSEKVDLVVHLGDYEYLDNPTLWAEQISKILGDDVPYLPIPGNHEEPKWPEYKKEVEKMIARIPNLVCEGEISRDMSCVFKNIHFVFTTPGLFGEKIGDERNLSHAAFVKDSFDKSTEPWRVCGFHKNQKEMQLGKKADEVGWRIYEACREEGALIATAHEHSYSRTYLLDNIEKHSIADRTSPFTLSEGSTIVFVSGLGGKSIRPQELQGNWWDAIYTSTQQAKSGALFCIFGMAADTKKGSCYFKNIEGTIIDQFDIVSDYK